MPLFNPLPVIPTVPFTPDLATPLSFGLAQPIVMFPVRLETRFFPFANGGADLCVRVYPDKVHIDTHEPELTEQEIVWGKHFWEQTWRAANDEAAKKLAWRQLVERFDAGRAAWVARVLKPLNPNDRPAETLANDKPLPKPINFPSPATKANAWTRAPLARGLPKRWHVFGYAQGNLVLRALGNVIPDKLPTGPDPSGPLPEVVEGELAIDDGMKWMVDFAEAEKVGMGIRARLNVDQARGFDILLVFGTKSELDFTDGAPDLVNLFDAHHYTDGLSFVVQGTPSNNTADAPSGFSSSDPGQEESYLAERAGMGFKKGDQSSADVLTTALGLPNGNAVTFANLLNANATEQLDARHMNRALWPATWGYFLTQMMTGSTLNEDDRKWARQHFINHVRASGPLGALRIGKQPYGVLPVTSLNIWKPRAGQEQQNTRDAALKDFLLRLWEIWRRNLPDVPRVGRSQNNPDQDFTDIFSMDGLSSSYAIRHLMGETYLRTLWSFLASGEQNFWWFKQQELTKPGLDAVQLNWNPRLLHAAYSGWRALLKGPITQAEPLLEDKQLEHNYIDLLLNEKDLNTLRDESFAQFEPKGLLYSLLRHGMLLEYWTAAANLTPASMGFVFVPLNFEQEIVFGAGTAWNLLSNPIAGITTEPAWNFFSKLQSAPANPVVASHVAPLLEFRESLGHLKTLSAAKLQRLFEGTLDLCSHRLDAWITSFATKRLSEMRKANPTGVLIGGYGWVFNLRPANPEVVEVTPAGEQGVLLRPVNNPGYTHTPSLAQAATVAVLRSGHLTHADANNKDLLAIDLSSERVRLAEWLLEGVRQGQPLGALLGYRFERRLQEALLGDFIPFFREVAPLVAKKLSTTTDQSTNQPAESIAANNVVDGLILHNKWKDAIRAAASMFGAGPLPLLFGPLTKKPDPVRFQEKQGALLATLNLLDDAVDAVGDALLAESVYHAVQGNPLRTASTLDAVASGETPPPELEVVRTPRTGVAITHRLVTLFSGSPALPAGWESPALPHRANAEPYLNAWAAKLLGNPSQVRCLIERVDPSTAATVETKELRLNELHLSPLDFIYASEGGRDAQPSEIEQRILYAMRRRANGFAEDAILRINPGRVAEWSTSDLSYGEFAELLRTARKLITGARGIDGGDLNVPAENQPAAINIAELQGRADKAAEALHKLQTDLQQLLDNARGASLESLREAILHAAYFGVAGAVPFSPAGDSTGDRDALLLQGNSIGKELAQRVEQLTTLDKNFDQLTATDDERSAHQIARFRITFGDSFVVLPQFSLANATELEKAIADSAKIQDSDTLEVVSWFQRASRVREGVARLDASLRYAEALETGEQLNLRIAQLPYQEDDRWVGLPLKPGKEISLSRFSLIVQSANTLDVKQPLAGVLIDEWIETVPNASETTGVVFQYDQPDATPPQCILLAVPPDVDQPWNMWSLQQVLLETLDLALIRAVDPESLDEVGHYLPALYFAVNAAKPAGTVTTDFLKLK